MGRIMESANIQLNLGPATANRTDLLNDAAAVLSFLADTTPALHTGKGHIGLTETSACGLGLILHALTDVIEKARDM